MPKTDQQAEYEAAVSEVWGKTSDGAHDLAHIRRVLHNALEIAAKTDEAVDQDVLVAAAVFHDLVNLPKDHAERHLASAKSAALAADILRQHGAEDGMIGAVQHAITAHSFSAAIEPVTIEARILQDADRLDALGAIGIARTMYISGALGRELYDPDDPGAQNRPPDDRRYALDHFPVKLFQLAGSMKTAAGRAMAVSRTEVLRAFYTQFCLETGPGPATGFDPAVHSAG